MASDESLSKIAVFDECSEPSLVIQEPADEENNDCDETISEENNDCDETISEENKDCDETISEKLQNKVEKGEQSQKMEDLSSPSPSCKTPQQINHSESDGDEDKGRKKKRAKSRRSGSYYREIIKNFTNVEIIRFVNSYKTFIAPLKRLQAVAQVAELQHKPLADLRRLGKRLHECCKAHRKGDNKENFGGNQKKMRGTLFKLGGVIVDAKTMVAYEEELEALYEILPSNPEERSRWVLNAETIPANFDVKWGVSDDSKLLQGIYNYGMGSWKQIKLDSTLGIGDKVFINEDKIPRAEHLQQRVEYLLKILKKQLDQERGVSKPKKPRNSNETKALTEEVTENNDISTNGDLNTVSSTSTATSPLEKTEAVPEKDDNKEDSSSKHDSEETEKEKNKITDGSVHITANKKPISKEILGDLDLSVFNECKEEMRPVKKALKGLDISDQSLLEGEEINPTMLCLIQIGKHINHCLDQYTDLDKKKAMESNLWYFVSRFTEFDSKKLYDLYERACKMSKDIEENH